MKLYEYEHVGGNIDSDCVCGSVGWGGGGGV